ncbi:MAG: protein-glutamate O-methyltransferase CheR [Clostridia bacterium]|nr:protein-glutamate O-methyltransferase CheR [Clostridia bacterium]
MAPSLTSKEFKLIQKFIQEKCGIAIGEEKAYLIESRLSKLLVDSNLSSFEELYQKIAVGGDQGITEQVIDALTTNETLWFRDKTPFEIIDNVLMPQYIKELREGLKTSIRIWSAACSTGQEPYSIAMCIDNHLARKGIADINLSNFRILATDISKTVLQVARMGRYDSISIMRGMENGYRDRYFKNEGRVWCLDERIKSSVHFQQFNLQNSFVLMGKFDLILCRNVIIYFSEQLKREVMVKIAGALNPDGKLIIGSSELFPDYRDYFILEQYNNGVYYRVKG